MECSTAEQARKGGKTGEGKVKTKWYLLTKTASSFRNNPNTGMTKVS